MAEARSDCEGYRCEALSYLSPAGVTGGRPCGVRHNTNKTILRSTLRYGCIRRRTRNPKELLTYPLVFLGWPTRNGIT